MASNRRAGGSLSDASTSNAVTRRGASRPVGPAGWVRQKGCAVQVLHGLNFFAQRNRLGNRLVVDLFLSRGTLMDQREFPLLGRIDAPSVAPEQWVRLAKSYRQAVRIAWQLRRVHFMTRQQLAAEADLYPQHVTDYLHEDDKPSRRDLPAEAIPRFEGAIGNTLVSQWLAMHARLTVLEEITATKAAC